MPVLNYQISPNGPIVRIVVALSGPRQQALQLAKMSVPQPFIGSALLDTGASCTCIDPSIVQHLGLDPTGTGNMLTPSTAGVPSVCNQYDVAIGIVMDPAVHVASWTIPVFESQLSCQGIYALIGRDILAGGLFVFNGRSRTFSLAF
jgi:hypothetical protein